MNHPSASLTSVSSSGGGVSKGRRKKGQQTSVYLTFFENGKCSIQGCGTNLCGKLTASNAKRHLSTCHSELPVFNMSAHRLLTWYASTTSMPLLHVENEYLKVFQCGWNFSVII
uniref:BED-type domain-containing protein n=1 Tax=Ditylenchus dipsaci TaxID=166011 RepID=A0A915DBB8_9BILA